MARVQTGISELQGQSSRTVRNTDRLLHVTMEGQKDAAIVKILAQIATLYLPASLIAVSIFFALRQRYSILS